MVDNWPERELSSTYWVHVRLFYPGADVDHDLRQKLAEELRLLQSSRPESRPEGTAPPVEAFMRGFSTGSIEAPAAPVPMMVVVFSNNDILFERALVESIAAIQKSGMLWAFSVEGHTEASERALDLIKLMMEDGDVAADWVPVFARRLLRFRDMMGSRRVMMGSRGHDGR